MKQKKIQMINKLSTLLFNNIITPPLKILFEFLSPKFLLGFHSFYLKLRDFNS